MTISTNEKSWWQKNRLWVVSGGCLAVLLLFLCIGAFVGMIFFTVTETFKWAQIHSTPWGYLARTGKGVK